MNRSCASPPPTTARIAAMAKHLYRTGPRLRRIMQHLRPYNCPLDVLLALLPDHGSLLDIGCGSGILLGLAALSGKAISAIGIDTSEASLCMARAMQSGLDRDLPACLVFQKTCDIDDWPDGKFDMVSMIDVMHHVPPGEQAAVFGAAAARLKPGGILLYKDMVRRPLWRAWLNRLHDLLVARQWIHYYPVTRIDAAARDLGLILQRSETINRLWYGHELRVYQAPV